MFDQLAMNYREQFLAAHGEPIQVNGKLYFGDGATAYLDPMIRSSDDEPPVDKQALAKRKIVYWTELVRRAAHAFNRCRSTLNEAAVLAQKYGHQPPGEDQLNELKKLQKEVRKCQKKLDAVYAEREAAVPDSARMAEQYRSQNQNDAASFIGKLGKIQV